MSFSLLSIGIGLLLLYFGAESLVRGAASLALRLGLSPLVVGLTVVAFGTSAPELVVSLRAALYDQAEIAVGNVVGSNSFNIAFILGLSALVRPIRIHAQLVRFDVPVMLAATAGCAGLLFDDRLSRLEAGMLLSGLIAYTADSIRRARREENPDVVKEFESAAPAARNLGQDILFIIVGLALLMYGGRLLLDGAVDLARWWGLSDAVIGLTLVAAGTSLPELATSVLAAVRKQDDIAIGNIVGSNIFNLLGILGVSGLVSPLNRVGISPVDAGVMIAVSALLLPLLRTGMKLGRLEGLLFLATYAGYLLWLLAA